LVRAAANESRCAGGADGVLSTPGPAVLLDAPNVDDGGDARSQHRTHRNPILPAADQHVAVQQQHRGLAQRRHLEVPDLR
jgi:hypothetical protein